MNSTATISTAKASGYLQQLCKHFGHKVPAEFTPEAGTITFEMGTAALAATDDTLTMTVTAATAEGLERLEQVMGGHLERFAFRDALTVSWVRG